VTALADVSNEAATTKQEIGDVPTN